MDMKTSVFSIIEQIHTWVIAHGINVIGIIFLTWISLIFVNKFLAKAIRKTIPRGSFSSLSEEKKREDTLIKISHSFFGIIIWIMAALAVLTEFGVPIAPLITGAGILGVAIGFGSQSLVRDIITGLFIIAENQFRIGDVISVGEYAGVVEDMTLRVTKLRQLDGTIHYIPNGEIKVASNKSKDYSMVDLKINVGYDTKIDHLQVVIDNVGKKLAVDPEFSEFIIDAPYFLRINEFSDYAITVRILAKVLPKKQYLIAGELRKRLKRAFEAKDIEIPYPTRVIHNVGE